MAVLTYACKPSAWLCLEDGHTVDRGGGPPPAATVIFGARVAPFGIYNTVAEVQAQMGPLQIGRVFHDSGLPSNWSSTLADSGMNGTAAGTACIVSTQTNNANMAAYLASVPSTLLNAGKVYMSWHHEPEGDYATGAAFVSEYTTFRNAVKAIEPRVKVGPIAEGDKYGRYPDAQAVAGNYLPNASICDFYGMDLYHPMNGRGVPPASDPESVITLASYLDWQKWYTALVRGRGKPIIIAEWGMYAEPDPYNTGAPNTTNMAVKQANRAIMLPNWLAELQALPEGTEAVAYWFVDGKSTEKGTFRPSDSGSLTALTNLPRAP